MERDQHRCKVCCKSFPSGRSLGGHMRSHVASNSIGADEKLPKLGTGYGLRENPKKTWRLSDSDADPRQKRCRDCGKEFQSWRALFGHMRCHSQKKKNGTLWEEEQEKEEEEIVEEGSWSQSDNAGMALVVPKRKRRSRRSAAAAASSSSVSEYDREQEDVAISLMMLSRDDWGGFNPMAESSDKNSVVLEDDMGFAEEVSGVKLGVWGIGYGKNGLNRANSDASDEFKKPTIQFFDAGSYVTEFSVEESGKGSKCLLNCASDELGKEVGFSLEVGKFDPAKMDSLVAYGFKPESDHIAVFGRSGRRSRFECTTCNKAFQSYQALGGHRASHKRMFKSCLSPGIDGSLETDTSLDQSAAMTGFIDGELGIEFDYGSSSASKKLKGHECLICGKVFSSGQALGGHKRCHLVVGSDQTIVIGQQEELAMSNLLDLNLPAPVDDGKWWIGSSLEQDQALIGIISN